MSRVHVDATTLIALGQVGDLDLLGSLDGPLAVQDAVREEVTTEPARTNVDRFCGRADVVTGDEATPPPEYLEQARGLLGDQSVSGDAYLVAAVLRHREEGGNETLGVVSDDRRVRTVVDGLGATVTGTVGVVVRAVEEGLDPDEARDVVERVDGHGLHMTAELRATAEQLIEEAAEDDG